MKRFLSLLLTVIVVLTAFSACNSADDVPASTTAGNDSATTAATTTEAPRDPAPVVFNDEKLYVGYGRENITPRDKDGKLLPVPLGGYPDVRVAKTILSDLYVSCTSIRDAEGNTALIFSVDVLGVNSGIVADIARVITKETGIPKQNIIINATHSHTAPMLDSPESVMNSYLPMFINSACKAAETAIADLTLCTELYVGNIDATGFNFIRRYVTDEQGNLKHESEPDQYMPVARFVRGNKKDVILANWAAHTDTVTPFNFYAISSDYIGYFRETVEAELNAYLSVHMAAAGDVNAVSKIEGETVYKTTRAYGRALGSLLVTNLNTLERVEIKSSVGAYSKSLTLETDRSLDHLLDKALEIYDLFYKGDMTAYNAKCKEYGITSVNEARAIYSKANTPKYKPVTIGAVSIGNIAFGVAPYEMFAKNGKDLKAASEFDLTFVCAYSNGREGYIAADYAYVNRAYEVDVCMFVKGSAEKLQEQISTLIDKLHTDTYGEQGE